MWSSARKLRTVIALACANCGDDLKPDQVECQACGCWDRLAEVTEVERGIDVSRRLQKQYGRPGAVPPHRKLYSDIWWNPVRGRR